MPNLNVCYRGGNSDLEPGFWLGFSYKPNLVEAFKVAIPHTARRWNKETKLWWVSADYDATLVWFFSNFYSLIHQQGDFFEKL